MAGLRKKSLYCQMGGLCSKRAAVDNSPTSNGANGLFCYASIGYESRAVSSNKGSKLSHPSMDIKMEKNVKEPLGAADRTSPEGMVVDEVDAAQVASKLSRTLSQKSRLAKTRPTAAAKSVNKVSLFF